MKKFFANMDAGHNYCSAKIEEIEYDHFEDCGGTSILGYDGDISPKGRDRTHNKNIRYSYFWTVTVYDNYEDAKDYLVKELKRHLQESKEKFESLQININNIEEALNNYER